MSSRRFLYFTEIASAAVLVVTIFSATAQPEISRMEILVTNIVENPFPQRIAPYGVAPRTAGVQVEASNPVQPVGTAVPEILSDTIFAWNTTTNEVQVSSTAMFAKFPFFFTNVSSVPITINSAPASCGCTTANLGDLPKIIQPQERIGFEVMMNVAGKHGTVEKTVTINTDKGARVLLVRTIIGEEVTGMGDDARKQNLMMASADRQAVFRDDCARCHVEPTRGKMGKELFVSACAICHVSEHRASMVPDLHALKVETGAAYWMTWITYGKPNSLMPAFSQGQGGILSNEQITSLVDYLVEAMPSKPPALDSKTNASVKDDAFSGR
jgi:cytochrome c5